MNREANNGLIYTGEMVTAAVLYAGALYIRRPLLGATDEGVLHTAILLLPVVPILLMATAIVRYYFRLDEYGRHQFLQTIAICCGIAACLTSSYPFIKDAFGLKDISIMYAWPVLGVCWFLASMVQAYRGVAMARAARGGGRFL